MSAEISRPPSSWPAALAMPAVAPYRPSARLRASPVVVAWMVERTWGSIMAAAAPWSARKATSSSTFGASPQASDVTVKAAMPDEEEAAAPQRIAEAAPDDEEHGVRDGVARHHQLQHAGRGPEVPVDRGEGDVDDEEVGDGQEDADQDGDQTQG